MILSDSGNNRITYILCQCIYFPTAKRKRQSKKKSKRRQYIGKEQLIPFYKWGRERNNERERMKIHTALWIWGKKEHRKKKRKTPHHRPRPCCCQALLSWCRVSTYPAHSAYVRHFPPTLKRLINFLLIIDIQHLSSCCVWVFQPLGCYTGIPGARFRTWSNFYPNMDK